MILRQAQARKDKKMNKRLISGLLSAAMAINVITMLPANAFALGAESKIYEKEGYTVTYRIGSEWDNNRSVEVTIENTGEESILNWALKYDVGGEVYNLWNSKVYDSSEEYTVIKNNGYNYEIEPGQSANYGYIVKGEETVIPEDIELCSRRIDVKSGYEVNFTVTDDWHTGFNGEISITNTSDEPIEAWTLLFDGNFDINNIWNAKLLTSENRSYEAANQLWTTPIVPGESASFGFTAGKSATENANADNFSLTAVVVGESTLKYPDFDDIDYELDSDSDGLPDYYEDILGTDKNNPDTDGDGLTDGYEVFYLGTDPLKADSDDNGVNDGDEDPDNDGLSNLKECELGTDPNNSDTDGDGLTDGAEVNIHKTDPLKYDTDEDGISDGDEIALGLDPNSGSTNGTPDSERTFTQTISADSEALSAINEDEDTPFKVSLEMKAAGVAENNVYARESGYSNAIENSAILGAAPEFVYTDGLAVEEVTVKFELNNSAVNNTLGTYAAENDGYKGIKRLNVFMFFEDVNMLLPIETQYDEAKNIVSATTDRVGTYCLMDMELFFHNLGIEPSKSADVEGSEAMSENSIDNDNYKCYTVNEIEARSSNPEDEGYIGPVSTYKDNFDVYFVVDRANYTDDTLHSYCQKILETSEKIWAVSPNVNIVLYAVNGNGYSHFDYYGIFKNAGTLKTTLDTISQNKNVLTAKLSDGTVLREVYLSKAVDSIINKYDGKRKIYGFVFFDSANNIFKTDSKALLYGVKYGGKKIDISVCSNIPEKYKSAQNYDEMAYAVALYKMTNGIDISANDFTKQALEHIYGEVPEENQYQYQAIIATGYKPVVLKKKLTPYDMELAEKCYNDPDYIFSDTEIEDCEDTDEDGLKDFEEVMFYSDFVKESKFITFDNGVINLPQVADVMRIFEENGEYAYVDGGIEKAREQYGNYWAIFLTRPILPILSDPTAPDSDGDMIPDHLDSQKLISNKLPDIFVSYIKSEKVKMSQIIFDNKEETFICTKSISDLDLYYDIKPLYYYDQYGDEVKFSDPEQVSQVSSGAFNNWYFIAVKDGNDFCYTFIYTYDINTVIASFNRPAALNALNKIICQSVLPFRTIMEYSEEHGVYETIGPVVFGLLAALSGNVASTEGAFANQLYGIDKFFKEFGTIDSDTSLSRVALNDSSPNYIKEFNDVVNAKYAEYIDTDNEAYQAGMSIGYTFDCLLNAKSMFDGVSLMVNGVAVFASGLFVTGGSGGTTAALTLPVMVAAGAEVAAGGELAYVSVITFSENFQLACDTNDKLAEGVRFETDREKQQRADDRAKKYNEKYNPVERLKKKGYIGIKKTKNGGASFKDSPYIYITEDGQKAIVTIEMTGSREGDFAKANKALGFKEKPNNYTWHHLDDYDVKTNTCTVELVESDVHTNSCPHSGACAQYDEIFGGKYDKYK